MKFLNACSLVLLAALAGPALAETAVKATPADACPLLGPVKQISEDCKALRAAYHADIRTCMDKMRADADARAGQRTAINSHTNRSRFLTCDKGAREKMAHLFN
jgi:hypothetical protein